MKYKEEVMDACVVVGYSAAGKWNGDMVYPIPGLWEKVYASIEGKQVTEIVALCFPPRSDEYFYTCGYKLDNVQYDKIKEGMNVHTFPQQKYVVFTHIGPATEIPKTYYELWKTFDNHGYELVKGMPEIEVVEAAMFGKEADNDYEMKIYLPIN